MVWRLLVALMVPACLPGARADDAVGARRAAGPRVVAEWVGECPEAGETEVPLVSPLLSWETPYRVVLEAPDGGVADPDAPWSARWYDDGSASAVVQCEPGVRVAVIAR